MKMSSALFILLTAVVLAGCSTIVVTHDYDTEADFSNMKTFDWFAVSEKAIENELTIKRVKNAVNRQLIEKGLVIEEKNPDFIIALHIIRRAKREIVQWEHAHPTYRGYWGAPIWTVQEYEEGTLILSFVKPGTKELIWRSSAMDVIDTGLTPEKRNERIKEAVSRMLKDFPPQQLKIEE